MHHREPFDQQRYVFTGTPARKNQLAGVLCFLYVKGTVDIYNI